jgi:hypothetical protein
MLQPVLRATSNIRSLFSLLLDTTPNIKCLQHRNATSATLKNDVCNNQQQMSAASRLSICSIEINGCNIQHQRAYPLDTTHNMSATSKLNIRDI